MTAASRFPRALFCAFIFLLASHLACCTRNPKPPDPKGGPAVTIRNSEGEDWTVKVELAVTLEQQRKGLMYRWSLPADQGMLFIYHDAQVRSFWMKNTRIPLDMIFIGSDKRVAGIVENAEPYTDTSRSVDRPSQWVLEVNGGQAREHGIEAGDRVYFFGIEDKK